MIGVVVVTHGQLATELVNAAETIVGDLPQFAAVSIGWHDDVEDAREEIRLRAEAAARAAPHPGAASGRCRNRARFQTLSTPAAVALLAALPPSIAVS